RGGPRTGPSPASPSTSPRRSSPISPWATAPRRGAGPRPRASSGRSRTSPGAACKPRRRAPDVQPVEGSEVHMKKSVSVESASALIDGKIKELGGWRGKVLAKVRDVIHKADPEIVEEGKWMGTPVWSHDGIVCTGETYKSVVKMTFAKGAALNDPSGLFNSSLDGNVRRAIDLHEGDKLDEAAFTALIRAAV